MPRGNFSKVDLELQNHGLNRYQLELPDWRDPWVSTSKASGYPMFYPPVDGQEEIVLGETVVKNGYTAKHYVPNEMFSAHQLLYGRIQKKEGALSPLSLLISAVQSKSLELQGGYSASAFRLPSRVTVNEQKRESWVNDLANPAVPLSKLSRNVPHGYRGEKLFEMLFARNIPISRAIWYIRAIGGIEIKLRAGFNPALYMTEFTNMTVDFLRKQLDQVTLTQRPGTTRPDIDPAQFPLLGAAREQWEARFAYTLKLIDALTAENLLQVDVFLTFLWQQLETSSYVHLFFVLLIIQDFRDPILTSQVALSKFSIAFIAKLYDLERNCTKSPFVVDMINTIVRFIRAAFLYDPDAFLIFFLSPQRLTTLTHVSVDFFVSALKKIVHSIPRISDAYRETVQTDYLALQQRIKVFIEPYADDYDDLGDVEDVMCIEALDSISFPINFPLLHSTVFPEGVLHFSFESRLKLLFTWATTEHRSGNHRPYAVAQLLCMEFSNSSDNHNAESVFVDWVDEVFTQKDPKDSAKDTQIVENVTGDNATKRLHLIKNLLAELLRVGVVSYPMYLQRMIARGETENGSIASSSTHLKLLQTVPLYDEKTGLAITKKRRMALTGGSQLWERSKVWVEECLSELSKLVNLSIDEADLSISAQTDCYPFLQAFKLVSNDGCHLVFTRKVIPQIVQTLFSLKVPAETMIHYYAVFTQCYYMAEDYYGLSGYLLVFLQTTTLSRDLYEQVLDILESDLDVWTCLCILPELASSLYEMHEKLKPNSASTNKRVINLLKQFSSGGYLNEHLYAKLEQEYHMLISSLSIPRSISATGSIPTVIPELKDLLNEATSSSISQLATTIWYRYHVFENWGVFVFNSIITSLLGNVSNSIIVQLLHQINERLPTGLENQVLKWAQELLPVVACTIFGGELAHALLSLLRTLVSGGVFSARQTLIGIIKPIWKTLLIKAVCGDDKSLAGKQETLLRALENLAVCVSQFIDYTNDYEVGASGGLRSAAGNPLEEDSTFGSILLNSNKTETVITPTYLLRRQRSISQMRSICNIACLPEMGQLVALIVIQCEYWKSLNQESRSQTELDMIVSLVNNRTFDRAIMRDPQSLASALLNSDLPSSKFRGKLLSTLLMFLKDGSNFDVSTGNFTSFEDLDVFLSGLTIWRLSVSKVEIQAWLERLGSDLTIPENERKEAFHLLSKYLIERVCFSGGGHTYLGQQIVRCYHGVASDEITNVAFTKLSEALDSLINNFEGRFRNIQSIIRLLNTLLDGKQDPPTSQIEPIDRLLQSINSWSTQIMSDMNRDVAIPQIKSVVICIVKILRNVFICAPKTFPEKTRELFDKCLLSSARLAFLFYRQSLTDNDNKRIGDILFDACILLMTGQDFWPNSICKLSTIFDSSFKNCDFGQVPESVIVKFLKLFSTFPALPPQPSSWDLFDHVSDVKAVAGAAKCNNGPIDLHLLDAEIIAHVPNTNASNAPLTTTAGHPILPHPHNFFSGTSSKVMAPMGSVPGGIRTTGPGVPGATPLAGSTPRNVSAPTPGGYGLPPSVPVHPGHESLAANKFMIERGHQTNFDFETSCATIGGPARDHRRTLTSVSNIMISNSIVKKGSLLKNGSKEPGTPGTPGVPPKKADVVVLDSDSEGEDARPAKAPRKSATAGRGRGRGRKTT